MTDLRKLFESKFPVPDGVYWQDDRYAFDSQRDIVIALHHNLLWKGFQAGYEAGREGK